MSEIQKIDHLTKRCSDLLAEMKRHERESIKNKKRADQLQKEKDHARTELTKHTGLREKLEKLCRELQKENNKLKVHMPLRSEQRRHSGLTGWVHIRMRTKLCQIPNGGTRHHGMKSTPPCCRRWKTIKRKRRTRGSRLWIWTSRSCSYMLPRLPGILN